MLRSMTGFGRVVRQIKDKTYTIEVKSLNSKGLDLNIKLPFLYREKEIDLRNLLTEKLQRGKVDLYILEESGTKAAKQSINNSLARSYFKELKKLAAELKENDVSILPLVLKMPNVIMPETEEGSDKEWAQIEKSILDCLKKLDQFRLQEGKALEKDLMKNILVIEKQLVNVSGKEKGRIDKVRERLKTNLKKFEESHKMNKDRFEQELIYYLEKFDISEEKSRLKNHCAYFRNELKTKEMSKGKKLAFIGQEIGREINTIGSKANDADIQKLVIQMKDELEKIKEQVNNAL